jgi:TldD protein
LRVAARTFCGWHDFCSGGGGTMGCLTAGQNMDRNDVTAAILAAKLAKGLKWEELAKTLGTSKEWGTAALHGQMTLTLAQAEAIGAQLGLTSEAVALLSAPECPEATTDLVLESSQLALQIHESVGHAIELDRILGWEAAFAGTSFLELPRLGSLVYGSPLMNITADATLPGALGSFGYDDEGTPAQRVDIVREGTWVGVLSGRDSASVANLPPGGMVRADGYNRLPMVRMTNVGLLPGDPERVP